MKNSLKRVESKTWELVQKYSDLRFRDSSYLLHSKISFGVIDGLVTLAYQLTLISYTVAPKNPNRSSKLQSDGHRWLVDNVFSTLTLRSVDEVYQRIALLASFAITSLTILLVVYGVWRGSNKEFRRDSSMLPQKIGILVFTIQLTVLLLPLLQICIIHIYEGTLLYRIISVLVLCMIPVQLLIHNLLSFDYHYRVLNLLQARSYVYFTCRVMGMMIIAVVRLLHVAAPSTGSRIFINILNFTLATFLVVYRIKNDMFFSFPTYNRISLILSTVYLWESGYQLVASIFHKQFSVQNIDADLYFLFFAPILYFILRNVSQIKERNLANLYLNEKKYSVNSIVYFLEFLQYSYDHQEDPYHQMMLYRAIIRHHSKCNDEKCLCFLLKESIDLDGGVNVGKSSREIYRHFHLDTRGRSSNGLTMFDDQLTIMNLKEIHNDLVSATLKTDSHTVQIHANPMTPNLSVTQILNTQSSDQFRLVMCSFFQRLLTTCSSTSLFKIMFPFVKYLIYEYKNSIAALMMIYRYVYSPKYKHDSTLQRDILLQNCIQIAKQTLKLSDSQKLKSGLPGLNITKVLNYRLRVHELRDRNKELLMGKIDLYSLVAKKQVDYKTMTDLGSNLYKKLTDMQSDMSELLSMTANNTKLTREALIFELCVLERPYVSEKLSSKYKQALIEMRNRVGSVYSMAVRNFFSPFNSSNIAVFTQNVHGTFRISSFTQNASHLFGVSQRELFGMKLTEFMPHHIAKIHDRLMLNFMNGESNSRRGGKFNIFVLSKQDTARSMMAFPKLELTIDNDVCVAALLSIRKKNRKPIIYTDINGCIVAANKLAQKLISTQLSLDQVSFFALFPRLYKYYNQTEGFGSSMGTDDNQDHSPTSNNYRILKKASGFSDKYNNVDTNDGYMVKHTDSFFIFQMMSRTRTMTQHDVEEFSKTSDFPIIRQSSKSWANVKSSIRSKSKSFMSPYFLALSKLISNQRKMIENNLHKILKSKAEIETNHYQMHVTYREVCLETVQKTTPRAHQFFKAFAQDNNPLLIDALMLSPEGMANLYKLSALFAKVSLLKGVLSIADTVEEKETDKIKGRSKSSQPLRTISGKNNHSVSIHSEGLELLISQVKETSTFHQIKTQAQAESLPEIARDTFHYTSGMSSHNYDLFHADIKPRQLDDEIPSYVSVEDLHCEDSALRNPSKSFKTFSLKSPIAPKSAQEKLRRLEPELSLVRSEVEKDERDQYKIDGMIKTIIFKCIRTNKTPSQNSPDNDFPKLPLLPSPGVDSLDAMANKFDFGVGDDFNSFFNEDASSAFDSQEDIKIEQTDPLRSELNNKDPSTLIRSSKVSRKTFHEAVFIRISINKSSKRMRYKRWEYFLYLLVIVLSASKITFKILQDQYISNLFFNEQQVNRIANMLRPAGFIYKECVKGWGLYWINGNSLASGSFYRIRQYMHYRNNLLEQIDQLGEYFRNTVSITYSFREDLPEKVISLFGTSYTLLLSLVKMTINISENTPFGPDIWEHARVLSRKLYRNLLLLFQQYNAERGSNISSATNYSYIFYLTNIVTSVCFVVLICTVRLSIYNYIMQTSSLILKIDKAMLKQAVINIVRNIDSRTLQKENVADLDNEDLRQAVGIHVNHLDSENSLLINKTGRKNFRRVHNKNGDASVNKTYSQFVRFIEKNLLQTLIMASVGILFVNITAIVNFANTLRFYDELKFQLDTSANINLASSSNFYLGGLLYRQYLDLYSDEIYPLPQDQLDVKDDLMGYLNGSKNIKDPFLLDLVSKTNICESVTQITRNPEHVAGCRDAFDTKDDVPLLKGFHDVAFNAFILSEELKITTHGTIEDFFSSDLFFRFDQIIFYQTICVKEIARVYMERILSNIDKFMAVTNWLMIVYFLLLLILLLLVALVWVPKQLEEWYKLQNTFLALNNELLSSMYIKSFFGHESA